MIAKLKYVSVVSLFFISACASNSHVPSRGYLVPASNDYRVVKTEKFVNAYNTNQYALAESLIRDVKESDEKWLCAYKYQAKIYAARKEYKKALAETEKGINYCLGDKAECSLFSMRLNLLSINGEKGFYAKMKKIYEDAKKESPEKVETSYDINRAMVLGAAKAYHNTKSKTYLDDAFGYCSKTHSKCSCKGLVEDIKSGKIKG